MCCIGVAYISNLIINQMAYLWYSLHCDSGHTSPRFDERSLAQEARGSLHPRPRPGTNRSQQPGTWFAVHHLYTLLLDPRRPPSDFPCVRNGRLQQRLFETADL